jgi:hypothetical protein
LTGEEIQASSPETAPPVPPIPETGGRIGRTVARSDQTARKRHARARRHNEYVLRPAASPDPAGGPACGSPPRWHAAESGDSHTLHRPWPKEDREDRDGRPGSAQAAVGSPALEAHHRPAARRWPPPE